VSHRIKDRGVYRKIINSWAMYDWANSAFATTIMAAMFPPFFRSLMTQSGFSESTATAAWGYTASGALLLIALIAPVLGAISDHTGGKKWYIAFFAGLGILSTALFVFLGDDTYILGSILFIGGNVGFAGANIFYESLLPHIAKEDDIDQISTRGYALGDVGGGILLIINVIWFMRPDLFFMPSTGFAMRAAFFSVAVWWAVFSIPLFRNVPEPPVVRTGEEGVNPVKAGFGRLIRTFRKITGYKQLLVFLIAFWIYNDGIGTIIKMATAYGDEIGIGMTDMIIALIITQFVGIPFTFAFGWLACLWLARDAHRHQAIDSAGAGRLHTRLYRRVLYADGDPLLYPGVYGGHGAGRFASAQPLALWLDDSQRPVRRVLWLL